MHQSIPAVPNSPPPPPWATAGHLLTLSVPGVGYSQFYRSRGGWALVYPGANPGANPGYLTHVFSKFIGKDEAFVKDWLVHQGLEKLVDLFEGKFSLF